MKYSKILIIIMLSATSLFACSNDDSDTNLTGVWKHDFNNILISIEDLGDTVSVRNCGEDEPGIIPKDGVFLFDGQTGLYQYENDSLLVDVGLFPGLEVRKISDNPVFSSGVLNVESSAIQNLNASSNVCAYRETDDVYNIIGAPYLNGFLEVVLKVNDANATDFSDRSMLTISLSSPELPGFISADIGTIDITEYTETRLAVSFQFTDFQADVYTGSIDVDLQ